MYVRVMCKSCQNVEYLDVEIHAFEQQEFHDSEVVNKYIIDNIVIANSVSEEELVKTIIQEMSWQIEDGVNIRALSNILCKHYSISATNCHDLIERIELELGMYSPDGECLYFAKI